MNEGKDQVQDAAKEGRSERQQLYLQSILAYKERQEEKKRAAREASAQRTQRLRVQGAVYRELRIRAKLTQEQIANKLGLKKAAISKRELGKVMVDPEVYIGQICELASLRKSTQNFYIVKAKKALQEYDERKGRNST